MKKYLALLIFLLTVIASYSGHAQGNTTQLKGRVINPKNDTSDVLIINLNSKESTITDSLGLFTMKVKLRDSLRFSAVQYQTKQIVITDSIFDQKIVLVNLVDNIINLEEVVVTPYNLSGKLNQDIERLNIEPMVNSSTLGLQNANIDPMTQSERFLLEADRGKYFYYYGTAIKINLHKILNKASGRTKYFEDMVARDEKIELENKIIAKFSKETMSEGLGIQLKDIDGFLTFCFFQKDFSELIKVSNGEVIWEYLIKKSIEFNKID